MTATFATHIAHCPLIAILRGVTPDAAVDVAETILEAGFRVVEVPLNSHRAFESIELIAAAFGSRATVGAGTVVDASDVLRVAEVGGTLIVSPNINPTVIRQAVASRLVCLPGYFTPTEAFHALDAGASGLKLFPAEAASPAVLKAHRAVLPKGTAIFVVGGITPLNAAAWLEAGATGLGCGSHLFRPDLSMSAISTAARDFVSAAKQSVGDARSMETAL